MFWVRFSRSLREHNIMSWQFIYVVYHCILARDLAIKNFPSFILFSFSHSYDLALLLGSMHQNIKWEAEKKKEKDFVKSTHSKIHMLKC